MDIQKRKKVWELAVVSLFLTIITGYAMDLGVPRPAKAEMLAEGELAAQQEEDDGQESGREAEKGNAQTDSQGMAEGASASEGTETAETEIPASHVISDFPIIYQMPELPTGCEITAAAMVLNYYGFQVDKTVLAEQYLPTLYSTGIYYGQDGRTYGNDMNAYFIGDPRTDIILASTIGMAGALGMEVIAEGVETEKQIRFLLDHRCRYGQGYYYSGPLPKEEYIRWRLEYEKDV